MQGRVGRWCKVAAPVPFHKWCPGQSSWVAPQAVRLCSWLRWDLNWGSPDLHLTVLQPNPILVYHTIQDWAIYLHDRRSYFCNLKKCLMEQEGPFCTLCWKILQCCNSIAPTGPGKDAVGVGNGLGGVDPNLNFTERETFTGSWNGHMAVSTTVESPRCDSFAISVEGKTESDHRIREAMFIDLYNYHQSSQIWD